MHQGIESVHQGVLRWFSDLASAENSVKKRTQFFSHHKTGTRSSKFVFYDRYHQNLCTCLAFDQLSSFHLTNTTKN